MRKWYLIAEEDSSVRWIEVYGPFESRLAAKRFPPPEDSFIEIRRMSADEAAELASDEVRKP